MPLISVLRSQKQMELYEIKIRLFYGMSSKPARAI